MASHDRAVTIRSVLDALFCHGLVLYGHLVALTPCGAVCGSRSSRVMVSLTDLLLYQESFLALEVYLLLHRPGSISSLYLQKRQLAASLIFELARFLQLARLLPFEASSPFEASLISEASSPFEVSSLFEASSPFEASSIFEASSLFEASSPFEASSHLTSQTNRMGLLPLNATERRRIVEEFQSIVGLIVVLASPLPATSLARLINIPQKRVDCRLDLLHLVLSIPPLSSSPVRLLHLSFRDFLLDPEPEKAPT
ncbi:hypothetical protein V8F33_009868 [Rhypophila sp. PSN 637]